MEIDGKKIARPLEKLLKEEIEKLKKKKKLKLTAFLVGNSSKQIASIKAKIKLAKKFKIKFELIHLKETPSFEKFMHLIKEKSMDPETTGIIIQQPLPSQLSTESLYEYIPDHKEIEGHKHKTSFLPPLGLAILSTFKHIYSSNRSNKNIVVDVQKDKLFFKKNFRNKKIVLIGNRDMNDSQQIGKALSFAKINYISINTQTPDPHTYFKEADLIISVAGKQIVLPELLQPGVVLIVLSPENADSSVIAFDNKQICTIASHYTPTSDCLKTLSTLNLYKNLLDAARMQKKHS